MGPTVKVIWEYDMHSNVFWLVVVGMLGGSLSPQHGVSLGCGWRKGLQLWRVSANILIKQKWTNNMGWSSSLRVGRGANSPST
jgi:hypothetical protein